MAIKEFFGNDLLLLFDGDSISAGVGAPKEHSLDRQVLKKLNFPAQFYNIAVSGRTVYECNADFFGIIESMKIYGSPLKIVVFHAGDNDLSLGRTAQETYHVFSEYVARAHDCGWLIVVSTELRRYTFAEDMQAELMLYNRLLLENAARADGVVDLDLEPSLVDPAERKNPTIFTFDQIHPSAGGYSLIADNLALEINKLINKANWFPP